MPAPIFSFDFSSPQQQHQQQQHRPAVSSPLSSSPLRYSQSSPPQQQPLSPRDPNTRRPQRDVLSSPTKPPRFKYASRDARPNPLRRSHQVAQAGRRKLFLSNVRQRTDDRNWERRGGDQEGLKLEWSRLDRLRRERLDKEIDGILSEEIEDEQQQEISRGIDEMMVDAMAQEEEAEMNALLTMFESESSASRAPARPASPSLSEDDDYDDLFMNFLSHQASNSQGPVSSGQMDLS